MQDMALGDMAHSDSSDSMEEGPPGSTWPAAGVPEAAPSSSGGDGDRACACDPSSPGSPLAAHPAAGPERPQEWWRDSGDSSGEGDDAPPRMAMRTWDSPDADGAPARLDRRQQRR